MYGDARAIIFPAYYRLLKKKDLSSIGIKAQEGWLGFDNHHKCLYVAIMSVSAETGFDLLAKEIYNSTSLEPIFTL